MAITIPSISDIQTRIANDLILSINVGELDSSKHIDPTIRNSFAKGLVDAMAAGFDENNDILNQLLIQIFPQTATGIYLERWASFFGITRAEAEKSSGLVVFTGVAGTSIPASTLVQRADSVEYTTLSNKTISSQTVNVASITRLGSAATLTTVNNHNLATGVIIDSITGANENEYNVTNATITVIDATSFTYEVAGTPTTPATIGGFVLQEDYNGYNGYKQVTVINSTTFTYSTSDTNLNTPAQGTLEISTASRIAWSATPERINQFYSEDINRTNQNWMFLVLGSKIIYKDGTTASDLSSAKSTNESFFYQSQQDFSIFTFIPSQGETLAGASSDKARTFEKAILKSIANFAFDSPLTDMKYQSTIYVGNDAEDYNTAYYVHRFDFLAKGYVQNPDTADFNPGTPLAVIDGLVKDKNMSYKPIFRS